MLALGRALADRFDVVIAARRDAGGPDFLKRAAITGLRIKAFDPDQLPLFGSWLCNIGTTLLHVHAGIGWEGHELVRAGKAVGLPVIRTEHLPHLLTSPVQQAAYRAMLLSVDRVIAVSQAAYESYAECCDRRRLAFVPNGIHAPQSKTAPAATRATLGLREQDQMVLTVARFTPQKGHATLLAAIPLVLKHQQDAKFFWVGEGPEFFTLSEAVHAAGLGHAVMLLGHRDDVADLLAAADAFVLPSLFEGMPLALLEAMAAGVPVIATAIGGSAEALGSAHPFLALPNDRASLGAAILKCLDKADVAAAVGIAGKARFSGHFQAERMARQTAEIYSSVLATHSPKSQVRSA